MLRVRRVTKQRQPDGAFADVHFRIDRKDDDRTPRQLLELIHEKLPGAVINDTAGSTILIAERGRYDRVFWNTANVADFLQRIGEPVPRIGELMGDPTYPWSYLLYTNFEIGSKEFVALSENLGIFATDPVLAPGADTWVYRLLMRPGNRRPMRQDIADLLRFPLDDGM